MKIWGRGRGRGVGVDDELLWWQRHLKILKWKRKQSEYIQTLDDWLIGFHFHFGTVLATTLPILFLYLNTVIVTAGAFAP